MKLLKTEIRVVCNVFENRVRSGGLSPMKRDRGGFRENRIVFFPSKNIPVIVRIAIFRRTKKSHFRVL